MTQRKGALKEKKSRDWRRETGWRWRWKRAGCCLASTVHPSIRLPLFRWKALSLCHTLEKNEYLLIAWPSPAPWALTSPRFEFSSGQCCLCSHAVLADAFCFISHVQVCTPFAYNQCLLWLLIKDVCASLLHIVHHSKILHYIVVCPNTLMERTKMLLAVKKTFVFDN